jgi:hypothetical protein
VLRGAAAGYLE